MKEKKIDAELSLLSQGDVQGFDKSYADKFGYDIKISKNTDLAAMLGGITYQVGDYYLSNPGFGSGVDAYQEISIIDLYGSLSWRSYLQNNVSIRPVLYAPGFWGARVKQNEIEYGYYPQTAESLEISKVLESLYQDGVLDATGNTFALGKYKEQDKPPTVAVEYEYNGVRYIRANPRSSINPKLSNGQKVGLNDYVWFRVEPVKWLHYHDNVFIAKDCLMSGINYADNMHKVCPLKKSKVYKFMNEYMLKDIFQYYVKDDDYNYYGSSKNVDDSSNNALNIETANIDSIYLQLDKDKDINRIFVLYGNGSVEMRNRNKDGNKEFKDKIKDFIELTGIKKEDNKIWKLKDNRENKILFEELAKKYYLKKFEYVIAIINDNIVSLTSHVGKNSNNKYEQAIVELDKIKDTMVQYIEQVKEGNFDFIMDGYIDENEMEMLKLRELVEHVDSNLPSVSEVEEDIETLETNLTVIDNLVDADDLKRR